jgi:hypothetical protein
MLMLVTALSGLYDFSVMMSLIQSLMIQQHDVIP